MPLGRTRRERVRVLHNVVSACSQVVLLCALVLGEVSAAAGGSYGGEPKTEPAVGLAKAAGPVSPNDDGTYSVELSFIVQNVGDAKLLHVQVTDELASHIAPATVVSVDTLQAAGLTINEGYDGVVDTALLAGSDFLDVHAEASIGFTLRFDANGEPGPFFNSASATGKSKKGVKTDDLSQNGVDTDPDTEGLEPADNPEPGDDSEPTPIILPTADRVVGLAKSATVAVASDSEFQFETVVVLRVENLGEAVVEGLQITDDLAGVFTPPSTFGVLSLGSDALSINASYDGAGDTQLLAGTDSLAAMSSGEVTLLVGFTPNGASSPFLNTSVVSADQAPADVSHDGTDPDPEGDGPADNSDPTPIVFSDIPVPVIGLAKAATVGTPTTAGSFETVLTFVVENSGEAALDGVQISDDLVAAFPAPATFEVVGLASNDFTVNPAFDGFESTDLLAGTDTLAASATGTVSVTLSFAPNGLTSPFENVAFASSTTPDTPVDQSHDGPDPDPDDDGPANDSDPTPIVFGDSPIVVIGLAKSSTVGTPTTAGSFETVLTFVVENSGDAALDGVQISDDLAAAFPEPAIFEVVGLASDDFTVNPAFDGVESTDLLTGTDTLAADAAGTVSVTVRFAPNGLTSPFENVAFASSTTPDTPVDQSQDGPDPDPDDDGPANNSDPTPIVFSDTPAAVIGLAKSATVGVPTAGGSFETTMTFVVENSGDAALDGVQISDDLAAAFPEPAAFEVVGLASDDFAINPGFDGGESTDLLAGTDSLAAGTTGTVSVTVSFAPNGLTSPFENVAFASSTTPDTPVDQSQDGMDPDPGGDGPADDSDPTPIVFSDTPTPVIGLAKSATVGVPTPSGSFETVLTFVVENSGEAALDGVQISDDLVAAFPAPATFEVVGLASDDFAINPAFDGLESTDLLVGTGTLAASATGTVSVTVSFAPNGLTSPFENVAFASSTTPDTPVDQSHDGPDPDPDDDGPANDSDPTPIVFDVGPRPAIGLAKSIGEISPTADGNFAATFTFIVQNVGDEALRDVQIVDELAAVLAPAELVAAGDVVVEAGPVVANAAFDGRSDVALLEPGQMLDVGEQARMTLDFEFDVGDTQGPYANTATTSGYGAQSGDFVEDTSTNGLDVDPDTPGTEPPDNPDPGDDDEPTPVEPPEYAPVLGVAKAADFAVASDSDETFESTVTFTLSNLGNAPLAGVQLTDDLSTTFPAPATFTVVELSSDYFTVNGNFDGIDDVALLAGTDTLELAATETIVLRVAFSPNGFDEPFSNSAFGSSTTPDTPDDTSTNGEDPDPDGDGPGNDDEPTPIGFPIPSLDDHVLVLSKVADRKDVAVGEFITYEVRADLVSGEVPLAVALVDRIPGGFQFVDGSALLVRPGPDGRLGSADDVQTSLGASGTLSIAFDPIDMDPETSVFVRYVLRVGAGVGVGQYVNTVEGSLGGGVVASSRASVNVITDPVFERTTVIGKVFDDRDDDGRQGPMELGVAGVRLATLGGLTVETDAHGRFHIADVDVARFERGANFVLKLDPATLPAGASVASRSNPRVVRLTQALMTSIDFPVRLQRAEEFFTDSVGEHEAMIGTTVHTRREKVASIHFAELGHGELGPQMNDAQAALDALSQYIDQLPQGKSFRLDFDGHASSVPFITGTQLQQQYEHNAGLSHERALVARDLVVSRLATDREWRVDKLVGRGAPPPTADECFACNRRVDISVSFDEEREHFAMVPNRGEVVRARVVSDPHIQDARLDIVAVDTPYRGSDGLLGEPIQFAAYTNHANVISRFTLELFDARDVDFSAALAEVTFEDWSRPVVIEAGQLNLTGVDEVAYRLKAYGDGGQQSLTHLRLVAVRDTSTPSRPAREVWGHTNIDTGTLALRGERVRIHGVVRGATDFVNVAGLRVPVTGDGTFVVEQYLDANERAAFLSAMRTDRGAVDTVETMQPQTVRKRRLVASVHFGRLVDLDLENHMVDDTDAVTMVADYLGALPPGSNVEIDIDGHASSVPFIPGTPKQRHFLHNAGLSSRRAIVVSQLLRERLDGVDEWQMGEIVGRGAPPPDPDECRRCNRRVDIHVSHDEVVEHKVLEARAKPSQDRTVTSVEEPQTQMFVVALANVTVGHNDLSGSIEPLAGDEHFDDSIFVDGRLAMYAKGKIKGKYLVTAQIDTTEDDLSNMGDNLERNDPARLFRQLDPDRYYAVYGDDSTTSTDVDTQGAFYLRVDWDKSQALWGNFETELTDTEFAQHNRTLYGAKVDLQSKQATRFGDASRRLGVFASQANSVAAHVTFQATGGSLYFLNHTDIVQGSEKVWIEVRRRNSEQVLDSQDLISGRDYEVDAIQGRIILNTPLHQVARERSGAIVRSTPLEGDDVYLLVDYEHVPFNFDLSSDDLVAGARARVWINDHVGIGATKVRDENLGPDYDLTGVDLTLKVSEGTYLNVEYADSEARRSANNAFSADGGLSFSAQNSTLLPGAMSGEAVGIDARLDLAEIVDGADGDVTAWYKKRDEGFSTGRLREAGDVTDSGFEANVEISDDVTLSAAYSELDEQTIASERVARVQADFDGERVDVAIEARHEDIDNRGAALLQRRINDRTSHTDNGDALLIGARVGFEIDTRTKAVVEGQISTAESGDYRDNDLATVGIERKVSDKAAVSVGVSDGDRGSALLAGFDLATGEDVDVSVRSGFGSGAVSEFSTTYKVAEGREVYGSYSVDSDRSYGERSLLTLGQRRSYGNHLQVFNESQFGKDDRYADVAHVFGLEFDGFRDWSLSTSIQVGEHEVGVTGVGPFERQALSFGAGFDREHSTLSSRFEIRRDRGDTVDERQYLTSNAYSYQVNEDRRWLAKLNLAWTQDERANVRASRLTEFDVGYALRPVSDNRWNALAKYSYLYDLGSAGQITSFADQRVHIVSAEALYDFSSPWQLGGKVAFKHGERRAGRDTGPWFDTQMALAAVRARYQLIGKWDALAEYRWLAELEGNSARHGVLLGVYRDVSDHMRIGVGYNFTDFSDDLKREDYDNHGWFVDLIGRY